MKLIIHRGTKEIGGSCLKLVTANTKLVLNLCLPLVDANREPFDSRSARAWDVFERQNGKGEKA